MSVHQITSQRAMAWISEHPPADDTLRKVMGEEELDLVFVSGSDARVFGPPMFPIPPENAIVVGTTPPTVIRGDGMKANPT